MLLIKVVSVGLRVTMKRELQTTSLRRERARTKKRPGAKLSRPLDKYPDDGPRQVFLLRAVDQVGFALFKAAWMPALQSSPLPRLISNWREDEVDAGDLAEVAEIIRQSFSDVMPQQVIDIDDDWAWDSALWNIALEFRETERQRITDAVNHREEARLRLVRDLQSGAIGTFVREIEGGDFERVASSLWNYESWSSRFDAGTVTLDSPFTPSEWDEPDTHFLFVSEDDLFERYGSNRKVPDLVTLWEHLSPTMKIALRAADHIRRSDEPSKEDTLELLAQLADDHNVEISENLGYPIVSLIRGDKWLRLGTPKKILTPGKRNRKT